MIFIKALLFLLLAFVVVVLIVFAMLAGTIRNNFLLLTGRSRRKNASTSDAGAGDVRHGTAVRGGKKIVPEGEGQYVDFVEETQQRDE